ncbi:OmpH family outer membrane protein [Orenia marismortui]|uniref:Periplasmic chaperone for outer membrane proteins Skp n=1 Tax=Orenia marismortui TaxID=46469 RepID=A0A4R8HG84_9FIRM|nr:OmpH family outer membrane protein [Orenia marismortui]TDX59190.1 periplasmic chaperone for outer membrane proteins Skp [Orenia marismortui]
MKKKLIFTLLVFSVLASVFMLNRPVDAEGDKASKVGYVDMQKLFVNHPDKAASESKLNEEAKRIQKKVEEEAKNMTKEEQQELLQKYEQYLKDLERKEISKIFEDINDKIRIVAEENGINVVVDKPAVIYGGYDLTDDVLKVIKDNKTVEEDK